MTQKKNNTLSNFVLKPITNEAEFEEANKIIDSLIDSDFIVDSIERMKALDILEEITLLSIEYEKKHYPIPKPN
jgi:HTH-type transcriptional regulator / antitoxin HigA